MNIDGSCHCGAITYKAVVDASTAGLCNCTDCQKLSGAPFRASVVAKAEDFELTRGTPARYIKTADSGRKRVQAFCSECGSPIYSCAPDNPDTYNLRLGLVRQRADIVPHQQAWLGSALAWAQNAQAIPEAQQNN